MQMSERTCASRARLVRKPYRRTRGTIGYAGGAPFGEGKAEAEGRETGIPLEFLKQCFKFFKKRSAAGEAARVVLSEAETALPGGMHRGTLRPVAPLGRHRAIVQRRHLGSASLHAAGNAAASGDDAPRPGERLRPPCSFCDAAASFFLFSLCRSDGGG